MNYSLVKIPSGIWTRRFEHDFINGGCRFPGIGFKLEAGYIFAPYVPAMDLETEFAPRIGIASRYGTATVNENYYGRITMNEVLNGVQLPVVNRRFV